MSSADDVTVALFLALALVMVYGLWLLVMTWSIKGDLEELRG
jgi:hypothetical protein